jgi:RNA polymerase sigma-70 factor (ECF subfamily)
MHQKRDWTAIESLYAALSQITTSPVVELNRAIAIAEISGPEAGLALVD